MLLTENDMRELAPFMELIEKSATLQQEISTAPRSAISNVYYNHGEYVNMNCGGCIAKAYADMWLFIEHYKNTH